MLLRLLLFVDWECILECGVLFYNCLTCGRIENFKCVEHFKLLNMWLIFELYMWGHCLLLLFEVHLVKQKLVKDTGKHNWLFSLCTEAKTALEKVFTDAWIFFKFLQDLESLPKSAYLIAKFAYRCILSEPSVRL